MNIYRLPRISVPAQKLGAFLGEDGNTPEFPAVFVLLGLLVGFPGEATQLFRYILAEQHETNWHDLVRSMESIEPESGPIVACLADLQARVTVPDDLELFRSWVPRVARFSFGTTGGLGDARRGDMRRRGQ